MNVWILVVKTKQQGNPVQLINPGMIINKYSSYFKSEAKQLIF